MEIALTASSYCQGSIVPSAIFFQYFQHNPFTSGVHEKVIHTNLGLKAAGLLNYVWPYSGNQTLKG